MEKLAYYCEYVNTLEKENLHKIYHDSQYGFPILSDNELFVVRQKRKGEVIVYHVS